MCTGISQTRFQKYNNTVLDLPDSFVFDFVMLHDQNYDDCCSYERCCPLVSVSTHVLVFKNICIHQKTFFYELEYHIIK